MKKEQLENDLKMLFPRNYEILCNSSSGNIRTIDNISEQYYTIDKNENCKLLSLEEANKLNVEGVKIHRGIYITNKNLKKNFDGPFVVKPHPHFELNLEEIE